MPLTVHPDLSHDTAMATIPSCENLLFRIRKVISMVGEVPEQDVQGWEEQLVACYRRGKITEAEFEQGLNELKQLAPEPRLRLTATRVS